MQSVSIQMIGDIAPSLLCRRLTTNLSHCASRNWMSAHAGTGRWHIPEYRGRWRRRSGQLIYTATFSKADGVDAPRWHLCAKVEVLKHHRGRRHCRKLARSVWISPRRGVHRRRPFMPARYRQLGKRVRRVSTIPSIANATITRPNSFSVINRASTLTERTIVVARKFKATMTRALAKIATMALT